MKKYNYNTTYFEKIDSPEKAYWLGFLYADGCVRKNGKSLILEITLSKTDKLQLEKLRNVLSPNNVIYDKVKVLKNKKFDLSR